ncbi:MAG: YegP family protein [Candidatus Hodarchaeota archaeon]
MNYPKFQVFIGENNQFYFRLYAVNGEIILGSEGYVAKAGCQNGIESVRENAPIDQRYQRKVASDGQHYFNLVAANDEVIGVSEMYTTEQKRDNGIEAVKQTAPTAPAEDIT